MSIFDLDGRPFKLESAQKAVEPVQKVVKIYILSVCVWCVRVCKHPPVVGGAVHEARDYSTVLVCVCVCVCASTHQSLVVQFTRPGNIRQCSCVCVCVCVCKHPPVNGGAVHEAREHSTVLPCVCVCVCVCASTHQSMVVQFTRPGNIRQRSRNVSPTGLRHKMTCRLVRTRSRKKEYSCEHVKAYNSVFKLDIVLMFTCRSVCMRSRVIMSTVVSMWGC